MQRQRAVWTRFLLFSLLASALMPKASADQAVYTDSLQNNWQSYGWATLNYSNPSPTHTGSDSISVTAGAYQALYLHHDAQDSTAFDKLTFWINGGASGGQKLQVQATLGGSPQAAVALGPLTAGTWTQVSVSLNTLGVADNSNFDGFWIQDTTGAGQPTFYVDDISLHAGTVVVPPNSPVTVSVNAGANRHAISPLIYGVAYGDQNTLADLGSPLNRMGGNNTSRYNWQLNADNKANDYFYESIGDSSAAPGARGDAFIASSKAAGADSMLTIPMIGWIAKLGPSRAKLGSFSVAKYGAQTATDPYMPDSGNGIAQSTGQPITGNDPNDANVVNSVGFETGWINHLVGQWGTAAQGGLRYYLMDNEPSIWQGTHRDVHPTGATMTEIRDDLLSYGGAVKSVDPTALVVGPEEWGWSGYFYSGYDQQYMAAHNYQGHPDKDANGGMDYLPWLLDQLHQNDTATGKRTLDVFSVHFYPQSGEFGNDTSSTMQLLRNRSTRQLWDPNYTSESWINDKVQLIPRIKGWVNTYYPGTKTALTEYNWGAESSINGATTQADIDGILGREGLDMATRWTTPDPGTPTYKAMKLFRNYDGNKSGFGDTSVSDTAPNPDNLSSFAAVRSSDGALTVMVISKILSGDTPVTVSLAGFSPAGTAQAWQLTSANAITHLADVAVSGSSLIATVPAQSVTLFIIPPAAVNQPPTIATAASATPSPVTGKTTALSVLGADDGGESNLAYTWATTGTPPAAVTWSANGTNAAKNVTATFSKAGAYTFQVTVQDAQGATATSSVGVTVRATPTTVTVTPGSATVAVGAAQSFAATVTDQFGTLLSPQPAVTWKVSGGGTISSAGLFTAATAGGPFTVTAAGGTLSGTAAVTVTASATRTLSPLADAYIQAGAYANTNFGTNSLLIVERKTSDSTSAFNRCVYLKFDLSSVTTTPASATLTMTVSSISSPRTGTETITPYYISSNTWTESGLTWNNAPGLNRATFQSAGTAFASHAIPLTPHTASLDVTGLVAAHLGQIVTIQLIDNSADGLALAFNSRNASTGKPVLTLR